MSLRVLAPLFAAAILAATVLAVDSADAATTKASTLLSRLTRASEASASYSRTKFQHWIDQDGDGCDTREEVLIAESKVRVRPGSGCKVTTGKWVSWYDGATWTKASDVDIDHIVALKEAWRSGAHRWSSSDRRRFANDLGYSWSLDAVTDNVNQSKGDRDPSDWLPPKASVRCTYAIHWVAVKYRWRLAVDNGERSALSSILRGSCGNRTVTVPPRAI